MDKEELVEYIASRVADELSKKIYKTDSEDSDSKKKILLLIEEGNARDLIKAAAEFETLDIIWHYIDIAGKFDPQQSSLFKKITKPSDIKDYSLVVFYNPTLTSVSKAVNLISEGIIAEVIIRCIQQEKQAFVIVDKLREKNKMNSNGTAFLKEKITEFMKALSSYGLNLISLSQLKGQIEKFYNEKFNNYSSREVVTKDDILLANTQGQRKLILKKGAIITPLAMEEAKRYGIEVVIL